MKNDTFKYTLYSVYVCKLSTSSTMYLNIPNELLIHVGDIPHNKHLHIYGRTRFPFVKKCRLREILGNNSPL